MASDAYVLSRRAIETLKSDHAKLRAQIQGLQQEVARNLSADGDYGKQIATGITGTTANTPIYPTSGNVVPVLIEKWNFTEATGTQSVDFTVGTKYVMARTYDGSLPAVGTHVVIERQMGRPGRRWWIRTTSSMPRSFYYSGDVTSLIATGTFYTCTFASTEYPTGGSEGSVTFNAASDYWELADSTQWAMDLVVKFSLVSAVAAGRRILVQVVLYESSSLFSTPDTPITSFVQWSFDANDLAPISGSQKLVMASCRCRPVLDSAAGRRYQIVAYAAHAGSSSGAPIAIDVLPQLHFTEIKQT